MAGVAALGARPGFLSGCPLHARAPPQPRIVAPLTIEAAHKKGAGSTKNGRDSKSKRRGVKVYGGQPVKAGGIIVRQLGTHFHPGPGVGLGHDYTLYAQESGIVVFKQTKYLNQVMIVASEDYQVPEGQQLKPGSRKSRRKEIYQPRALAAAK